MLKIYFSELYLLTSLEVSVLGFSDITLAELEIALEDYIARNT